MIDYLEQRGKASGWVNVTAVLVPENDPKLEPASCDRILVVDTWHHIGDREHYAAKLGRALKPSGAVLIVDFTLESDFGPPRRYRIPPAQAVAELRAGGLDAEVLEESLPKQYAVRGTLRSVNTRALRSAPPRPWAEPRR
jgi:SAM-dependent methyltransferase